MPGNNRVPAAVQDCIEAQTNGNAAPSVAFKFDVNSHRQPEGGQEMGDMGALRQVEVKIGWSIMDDL